VAAQHWPPETADRVQFGAPGWNGGGVHQSRYPDQKADRIMPAADGDAGLTGSGCRLAAHALGLIGARPVL